VVVLKPLVQALADIAAILAVVKGSAVNNEGREKNGLHRAKGEPSTGSAWSVNAIG